MSLPPLLLSLLAGFVLASYLDVPDPRIPGLVSLLMLGLALLLPPRWRPLPAAAAMLVLAIMLVAVELQPPRSPDAVHRFVGPEKVSITGEIVAAGRSGSGQVYYDLQVERVVGRGLEVPSVGRVRVYLDSSENRFAPGDRITFRSRLRLPRNFNTPGEFDYVRHLAHRDVFALASVAQAEEVARLAARRPETVMERWRRDNAHRIAEAHPDRPGTAGLLRALAQGERIDVTPAHRELLAASGMSHLFAISGMHFGLVAAALYGLGMLVWKRIPGGCTLIPPRQVLPLLLVPLLFAYLEFAGGAVSSWRAFLMLCATALVLALLRRVEPLRALCAVALVMLLCDPLLAYEASFQLSFSATLGIVAVTPRLYAGLAARATWQRYLLTLLSVTVTAFCATLPFAAFHFQQWAPGGLIVNLLAVPLVSFVLMPLVLAASLLGPWFPAAAIGLFRVSGIVLDALLRWGEMVSGWPGFSPCWWYVHPSLLLVMAGLALAMLFVLRRRWRTLGAVVTATALLLLPWRGGAELAITALSVGQGESLLVSLPGDRHVLVDAGGFADSSFDVGERIVVPALLSQGVERLEALVLTHEHPDHLLGVEAVVKRIQVDELWTRVESWQFPESVRRKLSSGELQLRVPRPGWQPLSAGGAGLQVFATAEEGNANDRSLVLYVPDREQGGLLCADLETKGVTQLLAEPLPGPVALLKLPHHGSRHSAQRQLMEALQPRLGVVSAGYGNRFRLPHPDTVSLYSEASVPLWRTDLHGTLRIVSTPHEWHVTRWKKGRFR